YVALSYAWGDARSRRPLLVGKRQLQVTENLEVALRHLADDDQTLIIWVDALCINQSDNVEKAVQVNRMGDIYRSASQVLVWLGLAADESDLAMQKLRSFFIRIDLPDYADIFKAASDTEIAETFLFYGVVKLFRRPWFSRVWFRQEVV
ncbi:heterokaryon incompatibility, partial [Schizothecium vesticola]